ncbi:MAG: DUF6152 family protein [Candidatus Rariloculaceae bacterium]
MPANAFSPRELVFVIGRYCSVLVGALATAPVVLAHHSDAGIDMDAVIAFEGTITEFYWRNPHVYFTVETDASGETVEWEVQLGPTNVISRRGWSRDSLASGDRVTVRAHPSANGRPYGILESVDKEGGLNLSSTIAAPTEPAIATSLAGTWMADRMATFQYPGGFDGFFTAQLSLTEKAVAAQAAYDPLSSENPEATCIGRPTPAAFVSSSIYLLEFEIDEPGETIIIRSEYFDEERTVHMDGREHPPIDQRYQTGHSVGRWDGDTLTVDTANFADHRSPYQIGVPSGAQKRVVETYRLNDEGTAIVASFTLEDPEYLTEPMYHEREMLYSPHLEMFTSGCDPTATSRFLEQ